MKNQWSRRVLVAVMLLVGAMMTPGGALADGNNPQHALEIQNTYEDVVRLSKEQLAETAKLTSGDVVGNTATLTKLYKLWKLDPATQPKIDFNKHILFLAAQDTNDPNQEEYSFILPADGNLLADFTDTNLIIEKFSGIHRIKMMVLNRKYIKGIRTWVPNDKDGFVQKVFPIPTEPAAE